MVPVDDAAVCGPGVGTEPVVVDLGPTVASLSGVPVGLDCGVVAVVTVGVVAAEPALVGWAAGEGDC